MIKRAEAEEAIEVLNILNIVAGKVFAVPVLEKTAGILFHDNPHYITNYTLRLFSSCYLGFAIYL